VIDTKKFDDIEEDSDEEEELSLREKITSNFKFTLPYILIIISMKISYFFDREKSLNFPLHPKLDRMKTIV